MSAEVDVRAGQLVDFEEPEVVVIHKCYPDAESSLHFGVMPGAALCGFLFTTTDYIGPAAAVRGDPRFVTRDCRECFEIADQHLLGWLEDDLYDGEEA
ncbi:hypothetical protein [Pimelobacter simplex]|uniref:hypothetical protein n=1 Tax=Nocardioides simplex TaxID=2045 RepID=UPI003AB0C95E